MAAAAPATLIVLIRSRLVKDIAPIILGKVNPQSIYGPAVRGKKWAASSVWMAKPLTGSDPLHDPTPIHHQAPVYQDVHDSF